MTYSNSNMIILVLMVAASSCTSNDVHFGQLYYFSSCYTSLSASPFALRLAKNLWMIAVARALVASRPAAIPFSTSFVCVCT